MPFGAVAIIDARVQLREPGVTVGDERRWIRYAETDR
jgi:hypothetical protein